MITNNLGLPQPFVDACMRDYQYKEKQYSVTSLLKGSCQVMLERRHQKEIQSDVADNIFLLFGSAVHSILENAKESDNQLKENKIITDLEDGYKMSGIFDLYDDETKTVTDYKTGSVWKVKFNEWEDYRKQLLMYSWQLRQIGFDCRYGEIVLIMKDHSKTEAKRDSQYPQLPVHVEKFEFSEKDFEEIERYIYSRFELIKTCETLKDDELPTCTKEERWAKDDKWAVMKKGVKRAVRVLDSEKEAQDYITMKELDNKHYIEFREGEDTKCLNYCSVCQFCKYYQDRYVNNE